MKKQKLMLAVRRAIQNTALGSTQRADAMGAIKAQYMITDTKLQKLCLFIPDLGGRHDYTNV